MNKINLNLTEEEAIKLLKVLRFYTLKVKPNQSITKIAKEIEKQLGVDSQPKPKIAMTKCELVAKIKQMNKKLKTSVLWQNSKEELMALYVRLKKKEGNME